LKPAFSASAANLGCTIDMAYSAGRFVFLPLQEHHLALLHEWLTRPHVAEWWQPTPTVDELKADYMASDCAPADTRAYLATYAEEPVGFIQCYGVMGSGGGWWETETDPGARGIDQFLCDAAMLGRGLGRAMISAFIDKLFIDAAVTVIQTDPSPRNARAIRCYLHAGFSVDGEVQTPDGPAVLMRRSRGPNGQTNA
jgi:RimJ/RimL family protein N-acetyltransferase